MATDLFDFSQSDKPRSGFLEDISGSILDPIGLGENLWGKPSTATITPASTLSGGQSEMAALFNQFLQTGGGAIRETVRPFTGATSGAIPQATSTSLGALETLAQSLATGGPGPGATNVAANRAIQETLADTGTDFNEFFRRTIRDPLVRDFNVDTVPGIGRRFSGSFFGSDRLRAEGEARDTLIETLGRERARLSFDTSESAKDRRLRAAEQAGGVAGGGISNLVDIISGAETGRQPEKERAEGIRDEFVRREDAATEKAGLILDLLGQQHRENIVTVDPGQEGIAGDLLAALGAIFACWVAREVYGIENPRWRMFRYWMMYESHPWFKFLYLRYGERAAKFIHNKPLLKSWIKKWMDTKIDVIFPKSALDIGPC